MAYTRSIPLREWSGARRRAIEAVADAHALLGEIDGRGRPREVGRPIAHAYVIRIVAEFQAFVRDLHDLGLERLVDLSQASASFRPVLVGAGSEGRAIDRGNAGMPSLEGDFRRLGIGGLNGRIVARNGRWSMQGRSDKAAYGEIIRLRNALAHGNRPQLDHLRRDGVLDTITWARSQLPMLNRTARALDRVVWDHLRSISGQDPW